MSSDINCEPDSRKILARLPSPLALRCFEAAARCENFSRAADELHLTHGAVSRAVRAIEDELGVALFERRNRGVFLTEAGRTLFRAVHEGFGLIREAIGEIRAASRDLPLVLSCEPTLLMRWLIPRWPAFQQRCPDLPVHLVAGGGPVSFDDGIALAIRRSDFHWPSGMTATTLFRERIGPVCSPGRLSAWFAGEGDRSVLRADAVRLHAQTRPQAWATWATQCGQTLAPAREQTFEHFYFSLQAATAGLGVAIAPWQLVRDDLASGLLQAPCGFVDDGSTYCLLSPADIVADSPQARVRDWLLSIA
ncbi:LysR family transcriptional regulator [Microvirgula aerodenitrificans]|uniref:LysR family transcriptional regulator n=1 Tax=Microvirgula aerodenitrificans TaxID=57480 RepID=UPI0028EB2126|nr:LysR family transcriptional regulator [Microvirgula aerodenitrificans]